jgi:hypothetical protein
MTTQWLISRGGEGWNRKSEGFGGRLLIGELVPLHAFADRCLNCPSLDVMVWEDAPSLE